MIKANLATRTNGKGLWSSTAKSVKITGLEMGYMAPDGDFGELRAIFPKNIWNTKVHGLIYTDDLWLDDFREALRKELGFSVQAAADVDYSEQGMQGDNYVSLDVGPVFIDEWREINAATRKRSVS